LTACCRQVSQREKARLGAQLADIRLLDGKPEAALEDLRRSAGSSLPADLQRRRALSQARALAAVGRGDDALTAVAREEGVDVELLRAELLEGADHFLGRLGPRSPRKVRGGNLQRPQTGRIVSGLQVEPAQFPQKPVLDLVAAPGKTESFEGGNGLFGRESILLAQKQRSGDFSARPSPTRIDARCLLETGERALDIPRLLLA
jgi:hypothetical protein